MNIYYILDENKNPIPCDDGGWIKLYEGKQEERRVGRDEIDDYDISTVFLALDHNFWGGEPLVFETMIFDKNGDEIYLRRYSTWTEAEKGHKKAVQWVKDGCKDEDME